MNNATTRRRSLRRRLTATLVGLLAVMPMVQLAPVQAETASAPPTDLVTSIASGRLDIGSDGSCTVRAAGWLQCWGADTSGVNGNGPGRTSDISDPFSGATVLSDARLAFRSVSRGGSHACAIADRATAPIAKGVIYCWGDNTFGQSFNHGSPSYDIAESYAQPPSGTTWTAVTAGRNHSCALNSTGDIYCWGFNGGGQLGLGDTSDRVGPTKVTLPLGAKATAVSAGQGHVCAVLTDGKLACWGNGMQGQLGNGGTNDIGDDEALSAANSIITMPGGKRAVSVSTGNDHTCVILDDGKVTCWGFAGQGRLGNGANAGNVLSPPAPVALPAPGTALSVAAGGSHTCALLTNRQISCWGLNNDGQIGLGTNIDQLVPGAPVRLPRNEPAAAIATGNDHTCALLAGDDVACWGSNQSGRSGYNSPPVIGDNETPAQQGIVTLDYATTKYTSLSPRRLLDTRPEAAIGYTGAKPGAGSIVRVPIPTDLATGGPGFVGAVVLNVTVTQANGAGFVTAFPSTGLLPDASNLNIGYTGQTIANLVTVQTGTDGSVNLYSFAGGHIIADLVGFYEQAGSSRDGRLITAPAPTRILDTRQGALINYSGVKPVADSTLVVPVLGRNGVPASGISAVVLNVTAAEATSNGYLTVWPSGGAPGSRPNASNINLDRAGQTLPNQVIVPVGADGGIQIYTERGAHFIVDVTGWFTDATAINNRLGAFVPVSPFRHLDTRPNNRVVAGGTIDVQIANIGHVAPAGVSAVSANVTAVDATATGFVTVYPPAPAPPNASNINLEQGQTVPNHVTSRIGTGDAIRIFTERGTHLLVDVNGYYI
jgi:alpha-tubulin suppressor-like RCC1 family protein